MAGVLFMPAIHLVPGWPSIHAVDFLLPFILLHIWLNRTAAVFFPFYWWLAGFCAVIFISIWVNGRLEQLSDYFEILKILKLGLIIYLASVAVGRVCFSRLLTVFFLLLCIFNFVQYFELFGINRLLTNVYGYKQEVFYFGKDTLGRPAAKRMFGLMGNPNNNAIVFLFFVAFFFNAKSHWKNNWKFYLATLMVLLCQSKTGLAAYGALVVAAFWIYPHTRAAMGQKVIFIVAIALLSLLFNGSYVLYGIQDIIDLLLSRQPVRDEATNSVSGRWEVWKYLYNMILQKPVIGHAPHKSFFYERNLYSENEYLLMAWRYGLIGLLVYCTILIRPLLMALRAPKNHVTNTLILFSLVIIITAFTNNPLSNRDIHALFGVAIGLFFSTRLQHPHQIQKEPEYQGKY